MKTGNIPVTVITQISLLAAITAVLSFLGTAVAAMFNRKAALITIAATIAITAAVNVTEVYGTTALPPAP